LATRSWDGSRITHGINNWNLNLQWEEKRTPNQFPNRKEKRPGWDFRLRMFLMPSKPYGMVETGWFFPPDILFAGQTLRGRLDGYLALGQPGQAFSGINSGIMFLILAVC